MTAAASGASSRPEADRPLLLCVPGAGASAGRFERMRPAFADLVQVRTFELPGRGVRFAEPSLTRLSDHIAHFVNCVESEPYRRWIVLGESLGAVTATRVAAELADSMLADVVGVITVSAAPGSTGHRPADEVLELLAAESDTDRIDGTEAVVADITAARESADEVVPRPVLVPMATIHGVDDGLVDETGARKWGDYASAGWWFRQVTGNHYLFDAPNPDTVDALRAAIGFVSGDGRRGAQV